MKTFDDRRSLKPIVLKYLINYRDVFVEMIQKRRAVLKQMYKE